MERSRSTNGTGHSSVRWCSQPVWAPSPSNGWPASRSPPSNKSARYTKPSRGGPNGALQKRSARESTTVPTGLLRDLETVACLLRRPEVQRGRLAPRRGRTNMRDWSNAPGERTHHLIEVGSLVRKGGAAESLRDDPHDNVTRWRRRGVRGFDSDREPLSRQPQVRRQEASDDTLSCG